MSSPNHTFLTYFLLVVLILSGATLADPDISRTLPRLGLCAIAVALDIRYFLSVEIPVLLQDDNYFEILAHKEDF